MGPNVARAGAIAFALSTAFVVSGCAVGATATVGPAYPASSLEWNVDRPGGDYRSFDLSNGGPEMCQSACMNEAPCVAFTFVNPGVQGPYARCLLKSAVPAPVPQTCCVSGTKVEDAPPSMSAPPPPPAPPSAWQGTPTTPPPPAPAAAPAPAAPPPPPPSGWQGRPTTPPPPRQWEPNIDRPGADYRTFELRAPAPEQCRDACWNETQCRAFTYVRPGVQGPHARCGLKSAVPPARPADCCLSGVK